MRALMAHIRPQPMAKENESPPVSGRRMESRSSAGLNMLLKHVLKNAPMRPMLPRSSHGVPGPGAMRLNIVCLRASSDAMATLRGGVEDLAMKEQYEKKNDECLMPKQSPSPGTPGEGGGEGLRH